MGKTELLRAIFGKDNMPQRDPEDESVDRVLSTLSPTEVSGRSSLEVLTTWAILLSRVTMP